ncbi:MAG: 6-phospho-3-hexuloisomerase [Janthinobacterium lividum]
MSQSTATNTPFQTQVQTILNELGSALDAVDSDEVLAAQKLLLSARRVFVTGAGRSGLAVRMAAMRLMHLGLTVYVAGEVTTPAIADGDVLLVASGSGTTAGAVHAAEVARKAGAGVVLLTAARASKLADLAQASVFIPAATKQDHGGTVSQQYAGALFEQSVLLVMDAMFQVMWRERGETAEQLWKRHANLE